MENQTPSAIAGLQPRRFWEYFEELSAIPRGSGAEAAAAGYVLGCATRLGLPAVRDAFGNVVVAKPATAGRQAAAPLALQSHLDMVCEKDATTSHDFSRDPLVLRRQGDFLTADGTTLGADNGVGVAAALAVMESEGLAHGPLELLFTVQEETGLSGAAHLQADFLKSRTLINLDSEEEGVLCVGCAGGGDTSASLPGQWEPLPANVALLEVAVSGLAGGHSGLEILSGRPNAIKLLSRTLLGLRPQGSRLCHIAGGSKRNAIAREAQALISVPAAAVAAVTAELARLEAIYRSEYGAVDDGLRCTVGQVHPRTARVMCPDFERRLLDLLSALPHGVIRMSPDIAGLVQTSTNLAVVATQSGAVVIQTSQRSAAESEKADIMQSVASLFSLAGARVEQQGGYPGWTPNLQSPILQKATATYRRLFGVAPRVTAVHAGLECGIIAQKYPGMDMVSLGPTLQMVHSPRERILIDSVGRYWQFLVALLEAASA